MDYIFVSSISGAQTVVCASYHGGWSPHSGKSRGTLGRPAFSSLRSHGCENICGHVASFLFFHGMISRTPPVSFRALLARDQIEKRGDMKEKRNKYRAAQKQLEMEKQELLLGKLSTGDEDPALAPTEPRPLQGVTGTTGNGQPGAGKGAPKAVGALDTVLGSLDKLVELEKRITSLEKSNVYDNFRATKHGSTESTIQHPSQPVRKRKDVGINSTHRRRQPAEGQKNRRLSFSKQKTEATVEGPSQVYYSVRVRRRAGSTARESAGQRRRTGGAAKNSARTGNAVAARAPSARTRAGASTFLTQLPDVHRHTKAGVGCPRGGEGFRSAIATKKRLEAKRRMAGDRAEAVRIARQDRIIREWMQSKKAAAVTGARQRKSSVLSTAAGRSMPRAGGGGGGGTASSRAAPNAHLQEFRDIRAQYAKRTEKLRRDLSRRQRGPERAAFLTGTRTVAVARPKPVPAASAAAPSRPARLSRPRPGLARSRGVRRHGDVTEANNRGGGARRVGSGAGLAVGGTGLRAARARRQVDSDLGVDTRRMREDGSRTCRAVPVLPRVGGVGRRPVGGGGGGMSGVRARRW